MADTVCTEDRALSMAGTSITPQASRRTLARTGAPDGLSDRQRRAIPALLTTDSTTAAARSTGISRRSLVRWKSDPTFRQALTDASRERFADAKDLLRAATVEAVQVLRTTQRNGSPPERLRAAVAILDHARRSEEHLGHDDEQTPQKPPRGIIIVNGSEEEYVAALRAIQQADGEDPDPDPQRPPIAIENDALRTPFDPLARYKRT